MKGTEKQIKWATEIQTHIIATLENAIDLMGKVNAPEEIKAKNIADTTAWMDAIRSAEYAGDLIDLFGGIRFKGDLNHDFACLMSARKLRVASTPARKHLLNK